IFPPEYFSNPTCVILTELPPGLTPAEDIPGKWASFDGYFFKRYKYKAVDGTRLAPLAIGRTITVKVPATNPEGESAFRAYANYFVPTIVVLALVLIGVVVFISRWFRSGDRQVRNHVLHRTAVEFVEPQQP